MQEKEPAAGSDTPPPGQAQTKQEISNASLLRNPSKVIVLRVSASLLYMMFISVVSLSTQCLLPLASENQCKGPVRAPGHNAPLIHFLPRDAAMLVWSWES